MILSIGCSNSLGPYDKKDRNDRFNLSDISTDVLNDWPSVVFKTIRENDKTVKYRHIAVPGSGILAYCNMLEYMHSRGKLEHVSKLLIQHTSELRLNVTTDKLFLTNEKYLEQITSLLDDKSEDFILSKHKVDSPIVTSASTIADMLQGNRGKFYDKEPSTETKLFTTEFMDNVLSYMGLGPYFHLIFDLCRNRIKQICDINDIKLYEFAWTTTKPMVNTEVRKKTGLFPVNIISSDGDMPVLKTRIANIIQKEQTLTEQESYDYIEDFLCNSIGHLMLEGETLSHPIIIDILDELEFFK